MFSLSGRTALITGASGGIGGAVARVLARQGARVALSGTRRPALEALAGEIGAECGQSSPVIAVDLSQPEAADTLARDAEDRLGGIDVLVHNAGITRDGLAVRLSDEDWQQVIEINLSAGFRLIRAALRGMMKRRRGRIIAITSVVALTGNAGQANYAASKAGMIGMIKSLAREVAGRGITANCVAPGLIETAMTVSLTDAQRAAALAAIPVGRVGSPDDVAAAVGFLASDEAAYVTGHTLHVNGGMAMA